MSDLKINKLTDKNYAIWAQQMESYLVIKGLDGAVKSSDAENQQKALAYIRLAVSDSILQGTLIGTKTAYEAWKALEKVYKAKTVARRVFLKKQLASLAKEEEETLSEFVSRAKAIREELLAAGHVIGEEEVVWAVLAGLPDTYSMVVTVLETGADGELDLEDVVAKLMTVEQRLAQGSGAAVVPSAAFLAQNRQGPLCWHCNQAGHIKRDCPKRKQQQRKAETVAALSAMTTIAL